MDDRRGHGGEHDGAEKAERVDRMVRPGGRQVMIDAREKDEDERHDGRGGERLVGAKRREEDSPGRQGQVIAGPSYSIVEIHVREELTKVLKANKLRVAWDAREASCARVERKLEKARRARDAVSLAFFEKKRGEQRCVAAAEL